MISIPANKSFSSTFTACGDSRGSNDGVNSAVDDTNTKNNDNDKCKFCGGEGHVKTDGPHGTKLIQYFACEVFVNKTPDERFKILKEKGLCWQCLFPGAKFNKGKHKEGRCQKDFICQDPSHDKFPRKKHVLVCQQHCESNQEILQQYKERCILRQ